MFNSQILADGREGVPFATMADALYGTKLVEAHFIDWFHGGALNDETWEVVGTAAAPLDEINGGIRMSISTVGTQRIESNTRSFDLQNFHMINVVRHSNLTIGEQTTRFGLSASVNVFGDDRCYLSKNQSSPGTTMRVVNKNLADGFQAGNFGTALDTDWHNIELRTIGSISTSYGWMDGVLEASITSGFPAADNAHPWYYNQIVAGSTTTNFDIRYCEVYTH